MLFAEIIIHDKDYLEYKFRNFPLVVDFTVRERLQFPIGPVIVFKSLIDRSPFKKYVIRGKRGRGCWSRKIKD